MRKQQPSCAFTHPFSALLTATLLLASLSSCKKSVSSLPSFTTGFNVYMAGQDSGHAAYWMNGQKVVLADAGGNGSRATGIALSGSDIYVSGILYNGSEQYAIYWKNGIAVKLTSTGIANTNQIAVSGNDVYITGDVFGVTPAVNAVYWKNGTRVDIAPYSYGQTIGMAFSGSDIYTVGEVWGNGFDTCVLWKNSVLTNYYGVDVGEFAAILFSGADMYITSMKGYSKNEEPIILMPDALYVVGIAISGQDIYISGAAKGANSQSDAVYWKNGVKTILPANSSTSVYGLALAGSDVYTVGTNVTGGKNNGVYWKNTTQVTLSENGTLTAIAIGN